MLARAGSTHCTTGLDAGSLEVRSVKGPEVRILPTFPVAGTGLGAGCCST